MLTVHSYERIRHACVVEGKSIRQIGREYGHGYWTVHKALEQSEPQPYQLSQAKDAPVLGAYKEQIEAMLVENERLPRKQRYTSRKIYRALRETGYQGAESTVRAYVSRRRKAVRRSALYLPLVFDPGIDAQVDWGEATVMLEGDAVVVQLFIMRLCSSRKLFVMAFPTQRQEAFLWGHVQAFAHFGGVPHRISYDNLKVAHRRPPGADGRCALAGGTAAVAPAASASICMLCEPGSHPERVRPGHLRDEPLFRARRQSSQTSHAAHLSIHHRSAGRQPADCHAPAQLCAPAGHSGSAPLSGAAA